MLRFSTRVTTTILAILMSVSFIAAPVFAEPVDDPNYTTGTEQEENVENEEVDTEETPNEGEENAESEEETNEEGETSNEAEGGEETKEKTSCSEQVGSMAWLICPGAGFLSTAIDGAYNLLETLVNVRPISADSDSPIRAVWDYLRSIANIIFIIAFLIIIYSQLTGIGINNYGIKRMLPRLIIAAILVNLSYIICIVAIDASNILGYGLREFFNTVTNQAIANGQISDYAINKAGWRTITTLILTGGVAATAGATFAGGFTGLLWLLFPILVSGMFAILAAVFTLAVRQGLITVLVMVSPIAFVAYLLPNTEKYFDQWRKLFISMLVFFPMFSVLYGACNLAGLAMITSATNIVNTLLGLAVRILPLIATIPLMRMSGTIPGKVGDRIRKLGSKPEDAARRVATRHQDLAKQMQLNNRNPHLPSTYLAQYLKKRRTQNEDDIKYLEEKNGIHYRAESVKNLRNRRGQVNSRGALRIANDSLAMREAGEIKTQENNFDAGFEPNDISQVRRRDRELVREANRNELVAEEINSFADTRSKEIARTRQRDTANRIKTNLESDDDNNTKRRLAQAFGYQYLDQDTLSHLPAAQSKQYALNNTKALNAAIVDAISDRRKADNEIQARYIERFNDMPPGQDLNNALKLHLTETHDGNAITAAASVMLVRDDTDSLMKTLRESSSELANDPELQKRVFDFCIKHKDDSVPLWAWASANMKRRGIHSAPGCANKIAPFIDFESFSDGKSMPGDTDPATMLKVNVRTLVDGIKDDGIIISQNRTAITQLTEERLAGHTTGPFFNKSQFGAALISGVKGQQLDAIIECALSGANKAFGPNAKAQNAAFMNSDANKQAVLNENIDILKGLSPEKLTKLNLKYMQQLNDVFIEIDRQLGNPTPVTVNGQSRSSSFMAAVQDQINAINSDKRLKNATNKSVRDFLGIA